MNKVTRFTDEFKWDAVAQIVERGCAVSEVADRLGISPKSLYTWKAQFSKPPHVRADVLDQATEIKD
ncbi:MAG: transposase [Albidovulum sp.]